MVKDLEACLDLGTPNGAVCYHTLNDSERNITNAFWKTKGMVCMDPTGFAELRKAVETLCGKAPGTCKYQ